MTPCRQCAEPLSDAKLRRHAVFCSSKCYKASARATYAKNNVRPRIPVGTCTVGAISEGYPHSVIENCFFKAFCTLFKYRN